MADVAEIPHERKRYPHFAGHWYESDEGRLAEQIASFLADAKKHLEKETPPDVVSNNCVAHGPIWAGIVPHAGYMFSGQTAAYVYARLQKQKVERVFLLGPSHYVAFAGVALPGSDAFVTPLGELPVDQKTVAELADFAMFKVMPEVHKREHSLEMQLPFIRKALGEVPIVPMIVGLVGDEMEMRLVGQIIQRFMRPTDVVIVSSDFTHFGPRYAYQPTFGDVRKSVLKLDNEAFQCLRKVDLDAFIDFQHKTQATICGFHPCAVLLSMLPVSAAASLLNYRTSQDTLMEDNENSVSYMSVVFFDEKHCRNPWCLSDDGAESAEEATALDDKEKRALLKLARDTIKQHVLQQSFDVPEAEEFSSDLQRLRGAFVTLLKRPHSQDVLGAHQERELRGCIGYIWPIKPLFKAVIENAIGACSRDYRFKPVKEHELNELQIEISVLSPLRRIDSIKEIVLGEHGIVMYKNGRQAVFLPHVATEFGWDLDETLTQLSLKAGCGKDGWQDEAKFDVFKAECFEEE